MEHMVRSGGRAVPLRQVLRRGAQAATGLAGLGIGEGSSVALFLRNDIAYLEASAACSILGAYATPVNWHSSGEEAGYVLQDAGADAVVCHADLLSRIEGHLPENAKLFVVATPPEIQAAYGVADADCAVPAGREDWDAWAAGLEPWTGPSAASRASMIYTSGTTGRPKGVRRKPSTPEQQEAAALMAARGFGIRAGMRAAMTGPLYHSAPNAYVRAAMNVGADIVLMPRFDAEELLRLIDAHRLTGMHMVPTMFVRLLRLPEEVRKRYDVSSVEFVVHGAAPCPPAAKKAMIEWWGPVFYEYYGSTEAGLVTRSTSEEFLARPGTVGKLHPEVQVRIYSDEGRILGPGEIGEIYMRPGSLPDFTYQNRDDARREIERDGYVTNGDIGYFDADGYLFLCDRKRDMIISGGVNIYPAEIEAELIRHPAVHDCAVFGVPDPEFGERVAAAVEFANGAEVPVAELQAFLRQHIAGFKVPRTIEVHRSLPREDSGKIFKRRLRDPHWERAGRRI